MNEYMSSAEFAQMLGVTRQSVFNIISRHIIPGLQRLGGRGGRGKNAGRAAWLIPRSWCEKYANWRNMRTRIRIDDDGVHVNDITLRYQDYFNPDEKNFLQSMTKSRIKNALSIIRRAVKQAKIDPLAVNLNLKNIEIIKETTDENSIFRG